MNPVVLRAMDAVLGWLLYLPSDAALITIGLGTAALLTLIRRFTTNQDLLRRCQADQRRLGELMRQAKLERDAQALQRFRSTRTRLRLKALRAEGRQLLVAIIPLICIATWCFQRVAYHPPREGEPVEVMLYLPPSAVGDIAHIVPTEGVTAQNGWVQELRAVRGRRRSAAMASWTLRAEARPDPYELLFRHRDRTYSRRLLVGQRIYEPRFTFHDQGHVCIEVGMTPVKLFGVVPGVEPIGLQPWLAAYILLAGLGVPLMKRLLRVY